MVAATVFHVVWLFTFSCLLVEIRIVNLFSMGGAEKYPKGSGPQKRMHRSMSAVLGENSRKGSCPRGTRPKREQYLRGPKPPKWMHCSVSGNHPSCLLVEIRKELVIFASLFPTAENVRMAKPVQTPGQLARSLQASAGVDDKAKLIPSPSAQKPGSRDCSKQQG